MEESIRTSVPGRGTLRGRARALLPRGLMLAVALALAGCASLSEKECRNANWGEIGRQDGRDGHTLARLADHTEACRKLGIAPDEPLWRAGRIEGLRQYCTAVSGRDVGARGGRYRGVCEGPGEEAFRRGFEIGRQMLELNNLLSSNRQEQQRLINRLSQKDVPEAERRQIRLRLISLDVDEDRIRRLLDTQNRQPLDAGGPIR
jgi:Protein of unknown function (DUF2799)